ncbi:MAG: Homoserine O-acetyltransferase [Ktedonobacterales bacterium]|jgi:homoserine O-acetyltransferase|nr:MAG: Homoserine O-acetyltransferase [Ktedonobacterales bacterium]
MSIPEKATVQQWPSECQTYDRAASSPVPWSEKRSVTLPQIRLDCGDTLAPVTLAYETWGALSPARDNVVLLCHALTGDAHACDIAYPDDPRAGWWNALVGPGRVFDTNQYFVVCSNVLGGCYGSTGPTSPHPSDGTPYQLRFPHVTIADMVRAQRALLTQLGIHRLAVVAGGSLGGIQALEWALRYPDVVQRAIIIASAARLPAQGLAIDTIARQMILSDPAWQGGAYAPNAGPKLGLAHARMLAMLTYTSAMGLEAHFGRAPASRESAWPRFGLRYNVETYLLHQGDKFAHRFDANSYLYLTSAMDQYDVTRSYGPDAVAYARLRANVLAIGISSDWLYPPSHVRALAAAITMAGGRATYAEITSPHGHDAFLKEWTQLDEHLRQFLNIPTSDAPLPPTPNGRAPPYKDASPPTTSTTFNTPNTQEHNCDKP